MATVVPREWRDPKTPEEVEVTDVPRTPETDPTLGVKVERDRTGRPTNRLVAIGDSITQGFQSGAIFNTSLSYPALIARELGWFDRFRFPSYAGHGGLPLNIEVILRELEHEFGHEVDPWEFALAGFRIRQHMDRIEDWWERGPGASPRKPAGINHNLAIYGWDLRDTLERNAENCAAEIGQPTDALLRQVVEHHNQRAAVRVLASARDGNALTPFEAARALGEGGPTAPDVTSATPSGEGIETLIVWLGANNALRVITDLKVVWSEAGYDNLEGKANYTVWRPSHFKAELDQVVEQVRLIKARHVIWATVPHVTIAPLARGLGSKVRAKSRYFSFYARPWVDKRSFDPSTDPHITEREARDVDSAIDQYNKAIVEMVRAERERGRDWYLLDLAGTLDRLATRRYLDDPSAMPAWWTPYKLPSDLAALSPPPTTEFFNADPSGRTAGGLFSLDGVHPTTIAYGVIAQEFINVMQLAGVPFFRSNGVTRRNGPVRIDFAKLCRADTLIADPPKSLDSGLGLIGWLDEQIDLVSGLLGRPGLF